MGGGGSAGGDIQMRKPAEERKRIQNWYGMQQQQLGKYTAQSPLLSRAQAGATQTWDALGPRLFPIEATQAPIQDIYANLPGAGAVAGLESSYNRNVAPLIASGGALSPQAARDVAQQTRSIQSQQGTAGTTGALGSELLNREQYQQQRYNTAIQQAGALRSGEAQIGQNKSSIANAMLGLESGVQGLQTGGLNQLLGVESGKVGNFTTLENPILGYLGSLFQGNQQASIAQAQIAAQQQAQGKAGQSSAIGGALSAVGSIAGAFSDERIKTKIKSTGKKSSEGIPIKTWEYKFDPQKKRYEGEMAQDVEKKFPWAVLTDKMSGLKIVTGKFIPREV